VDDIEHGVLTAICDGHFGRDGRIGSLIWKGATDNNPTRIAVEHEYILCYARAKDDLEEQWSSATSETKELMLRQFDRIREESTSVAETETRFAAFAMKTRETRRSVSI
jgi:adenine-specific DNA-methyltransferase